MKMKLLYLFLLISTLSYAQTFDWESVSFNGTNYVRQTVAGIQAECTNSSNDIIVLNGGGFAGTSGNVIVSNQPVNSMTVAFSAPIDIQSIYVFDAYGAAGIWTFVPTGGVNSNVVETLAFNGGGSNVNVSWTNVTSFTITNSNGLGRFSIDDIVFTIPTCADINIPDVNFKAYLVGNTAINTNGDAEIQCGEATAFTGIINCSYLSISDLTGIEAFINITELYAQHNSITSLNVSTNTALERFACGDNSLTSLNVSGATALELMWCENNNTLTSLDVSTNTALRGLYCYDGSLISLDVSGATALETLKIYNNAITNLDVSTNVALRYLECNNNQLTSLDTSANTDLRELFCQNNALTNLNVANGNNASIIDFSAINNPNLVCVNVDSVPYSDSNWASIDMQTSFSVNCSLNVESLEIDNISVYPNPVNSTLNIKLEGTLERVEVYSTLGEKVLESEDSRVNVSNLSSGLYLLKVYTQDDRVGVKRFVKQ